MIMSDPVAPDEGRMLRPRHLLIGVGILALGAGLGAGLMYLLDPASGRRRRDLLRDGLAGAGGESLGDDTGERARGIAAAVRARLHIHRADGRSLEAKVRARLGRVASNPAAIAVTAEGSRVTLRGSVPPDELDDVLDEVAGVQGVQEVFNLLQVQLGAPYLPGNH
jgi:hypothetical protein